MTPLLETRGISKRFGGLEAVSGVDLPRSQQAEHGGIVLGDHVEGTGVRFCCGTAVQGGTVVARNVDGLVSGRLRPTTGEVRLAGRDITRLRSWERALLGIVYTFQVTSIYRKLSVHDNVALAAQRRRLRTPLDWIALDRRPVEAAVDAALADGHQRLVEVAMALALGPELLILDEPTQGLAGDEIEALCRLVRRIAGTTTVLLIEHNMGVVLELAGRVTVMDRGRILAEGTPAEIEAHPEVQRAYLGR